MNTLFYVAVFLMPLNTSLLRPARRDEQGSKQLIRRMWNTNRGSGFVPYEWYSN
jgi:hypothetical protein